MHRLIFTLTVFFFCSCNQNRIKKIDSPLAVVIKLQCAEELGDLNEARKYQNIQRIYGELARKSILPGGRWKALQKIGVVILGMLSF